MTEMKQVFIGGCDRSGTTMLASMLGGHSALLCLPESHFIQEFASAPFHASNLLARIENHPRFELWGVELGDKKRAQLSSLDNYVALTNQLSSCYAQEQRKTGYLTWVDHAPRNCARFLTLARVFPEARFIHMIRDGRAVASSWIDLDWGPNTVTAVADVWALRLAQGLSAEAALGDRIIRVRYEDVVADPKNTMQRVCKLAGIAYQDAMLDARGFQLPTHSRHTHSLLTPNTKVGVSADRLDSWRKKLSARQIELFESRTADLLEAMGYVPTNASPKHQTRKEKLGDLVQEIVVAGRNIARRNRRHGFKTFR